MHTRVAGFGVQVPFGDTPSDVHTAVLFPVGTNPVLHLNIISVPRSVLGTFAMEPFPGARGIPQLTEEAIINEDTLIGMIASLSWYCTTKNSTELGYGATRKEIM